MPAALSARPRAVRTKAKAQTARSKAHASPKVHVAEHVRSDRHPATHIAEHPAASKHIRHEAKAIDVRDARSAPTRHKAVVTQQRIAEPEQRHPIPAPLKVAATPAPEANETGVSHPPDFNDDDAPAAIPVPAVSVIRKTTVNPQLPEVQEVASTPEILPTLYNKRGRLIMPPPLKGSHEILLHQNEVADRDGLQRVQDDNDLENMRRQNMLVALPVSSGLQVDERLPVNRRYCRPWTAQFLATMSRAYYERFHTPLQVNSAVRTVEFQQHLIRVNGNAAPAEGDTASPHLTGQAIDLAKHGLSLSQIAWMRGYLLPLIQEGKIDVEEEFQQACFHISVYKKYLPPASVPRRSIASTRRSATGSLAVAIP